MKLKSPTHTRLSLSWREKPKQSPRRLNPFHAKKLVLGGLVDGCLAAFPGLTTLHRAECSFTSYSRGPLPNFGYHGEIGSVCREELSSGLSDCVYRSGDLQFLCTAGAQLGARLRVPGSGEGSKCLPGASRQGGAGAASRCAAALGRRRTGTGGVRGALWAAAAGGPAFGKGRERVAGDPRAWGAVRSAPASAPPASEGGTGALRTQAARAPAGSSTTASWTPGQPPPGAAAAPQRTRERTHRARIATGGALDAAGLGYPRGCKVMGSPDWLAASSRFASGTGQVIISTTDWPFPK
ncbi:uncharacterized protein LOC143268381 [Peromyscus maniculatus bairdii]|uniref:uncharacterized protein LOC143268381 n=1 Tax=Peromyscus maniculatus bairdii TaxID=230844 RepID=UPI003FD608D2